MVSRKTTRLCKKCGKEFSDELINCPYCGKSIPRKEIKERENARAVIRKKNKTPYKDRLIEKLESIGYGLGGLAIGIVCALVLILIIIGVLKLIESIGDIAIYITFTIALIGANIYMITRSIRCIKSNKFHAKIHGILLLIVTAFDIVASIYFFIVK